MRGDYKEKSNAISEYLRLNFIFRPYKRLLSQVSLSLSHSQPRKTTKRSRNKNAFVLQDTVNIFRSNWRRRNSRNWASVRERDFSIKICCQRRNGCFVREDIGIYNLPSLFPISMSTTSPHTLHGVFFLQYHSRSLTFRDMKVCIIMTLSHGVLGCNGALKRSEGAREPIKVYERILMLLVEMRCWWLK